MVCSSCLTCKSSVQDKDLKQYMDDCGNIMSMHNVKVRAFRSSTRVARFGASLNKMLFT